MTHRRKGNWFSRCVGVKRRGGMTFKKAVAACKTTHGGKKRRKR